jgi:hypothetical protein
MWHTTLLLLLGIVAACARPPRHATQRDSAQKARALVARIASGPTRVAPRTTADSEVVRRLCVAPDSVLTGRVACVLRNQAAFRVF